MGVGVCSETTHVSAEALRTMTPSNLAPCVRSIGTALLLLIIHAAVLSGQTMRASRTYVSLAIGASRSCDGLDFLDVSSLSQWSPMVTLGLGLRISDYFGVEAHTALMLSDLSARGTLVATRELASITAGHQSIVISPKIILPVSDDSEVFLRAGMGFLLSQSIISSSSSSSVARTSSNVGYAASVGYALQLGGSTVATLQFDVSDAYGSAEVWNGGLGLLSIGVLYALDDHR